MIHAVLKYVEQGAIIADLLKSRILATDALGKLISWDKHSRLPRPEDPVFRNLSGNPLDQGDIFIRWRVEIPGQLESAVWKDEDLRKRWISYNASQMKKTSLCMATGKMTLISLTHPKRIRHAADGAKLISCNDTIGYTNRGRFTDTTGEQACTIGYVASQKAHVALRWLIERQSYRNGDQVIVTWSPSGADIPDLYANPFTIEESSDSRVYDGDVGQFYALALKKKIAGYRSSIPETTNIIIMGLDNAVPGRLAITFYREFSPSDFLKNISRWHEWTAWPQNYGKDRHFVGPPSPKDIASAAYGDRDREKRQIRSCIERLLLCVVDARPIPPDVISAVYHRALNRVGLNPWEWEKILGIACALQRNFALQHQKDYSMSLEPNRTDRDYLFGRLLAVADEMERYAIYLAGEKRDSTAAKLMQRYADHPCDTWKHIELALGPYKSRLLAKRPSRLRFLESQIDEIMCLFRYDDFTSQAKLDGSFLIGYHCQRTAFRAGSTSSS
jgi:CRISPR-associated protein Csd1